MKRRTLGRELRVYEQLSVTTKHRTTPSNTHSGHFSRLLRRLRVEELFPGSAVSRHADAVGRVVELALADGDDREDDVALVIPALEREHGVGRVPVADLQRVGPQRRMVAAYGVGIRPHLVRTYKVSRDPEFAAKVKDVVGLYLNPPDNAVVLSVDEKTSIQALQRTQMPLPLRTGRAVRHTHDYKRHGVVDLYAALEVATGKVTHKLTEAHTAADFLGFMKKVVRAYPDQELHVILDNSSTHSTPDIEAWLSSHPEVHFHYTPTSASWLNQVEGFFGILGKQSLGVTNFDSKRALRDYLNAFMRSWNSNPTPFAWTKPATAIIRSHRRMLDRISTAVH